MFIRNLIMGLQILLPYTDQEDVSGLKTFGLREHYHSIIILTTTKVSKYDAKLLKQLAWEYDKKGDWWVYITDFEKVAEDYGVDLDTYYKKEKELS